MERLARGFDRDVNSDLVIDSFGPALRLARRRCGWTQAELAKQLGCHQATISRWETGDEQADIKSRLRLAQALDVRPEALGVAVGADALQGAVYGLLDDQLQQAESLRMRGRSREARALLVHLPALLDATPLDGDGQARQVRWARLRQTQAVVFGDLLPRDRLPIAIRASGAAVRLTEDLQDVERRLWWRSLIRHGNELRKYGTVRRALRYLQLSADVAPTFSNHGSSLIVLARAHAQLNDRSEFRATMRLLRHEAENHDAWTRGFNSLAVDEVELRGAIQLGLGTGQVDSHSRLLLDGQAAADDHAAPQWTALAHLSCAEAYLRRHDLDMGTAHLAEAITEADTLGLGRQLERSLALLKSAPSTPGIRDLVDRAIAAAVRARI